METLEEGRSKDGLTKKKPGRSPRRTGGTKRKAAEPAVLDEVASKAAEPSGKSKAKKKPSGPPAASKAKAIRAVKRQCKQKVVEEMDAIITGLIEKAKKDCGTAKFLIGFADEPNAADKGDGATEPNRDDCLAELLLKRLEDEPGQPAPTEANRRGKTALEPKLQTARGKTA